MENELESPLQSGRDGDFWRHTFEFRWHADLLGLFLDGEEVAVIPLTGEQTLEPWMRAGAMCIASPGSPIADFTVDALPWQYRATFGHPRCSYCQREHVWHAARFDGFDATTWQVPLLPLTSVERQVSFLSSNQSDIDDFHVLPRHAEDGKMKSWPLAS